MNSLYLNPVVALYANDNDALIPEVWAGMGLAILEENMVAAALVHRDFEDEVARFGDVVNTRRPEQPNFRRKTDADNIELTDAILNNVQVPLNQHLYTSFTIKDGEASKSMQDLVDIHLLPRMQTIARGVDRAVLGQTPQYLANVAGKLNGLDSSNARDTLLETREVMNVNKAFVQGRHLVVSPQSETELLKTDLFTAANQRGDGGTALEQASLGRLYGYDIWMDQNVPFNAKVSSDVATGVTDLAYTAGHAGVIDVTVLAYNAIGGEFVSIAGDQQVRFITAFTNVGADVDDITLDAALKFDVAAGAEVCIYTPALVDNAGGYAAGYAKDINLDGFTNAPSVGQMLAFGTGASRRTYTIIQVELVGGDAQVWLDRPLELAVADNDPAFPGPDGSLNLALHREALALVSRPLALPSSQMGVMSQVAVHNDISMRASMQYDINAQGTVVTLDLLFGMAVLDTDLAAVMLG